MTTVPRFRRADPAPDHSPVGVAIYYEHLYPESRGGGERQYDAFAREWVRRGAKVTYVTRKHTPHDPHAARTYDVREIQPEGSIYDDQGVRSPAGALRFALSAFQEMRRRRRVDDCVMVSSTPVLLTFAGRAALLGSRDTVMIVDWLEVWTRAQWQEYLGRPKGALAWVLQGVAIWATPIATCHSRMTESRLVAVRPGVSVLRSPGLIDGEAIPHIAGTDPMRGMYALFVGRLIADKNVLYLPDAIARVRDMVPEFRCVVVGSGPLHDDLQHAIEARGLTEAFTIRSGLSEAELRGLMTSATCLLHPSQREGYGLVIVEAASCGTPCVVLDAPDNAAVELIDEGVNGFVAPSVDADDLARAVLRCVEGGPSLRASTLSWYTDARRSRSIQKSASLILDHIESLLTRRRSR